VSAGVAETGRSGRTARLVAVVSVIGALVAGCAWDDAVDSRAATAGLPSTRADIEAHEWLLDREDSSLTVEDDTPVTLAVDGDTVSGRAPCNIYRGPFDLGADDSVDIGDLAVTQMACGAATMDAEAEYLAALEAVDHVEVELDEEGRDALDRMTLTGDDDLRLSFRGFDTRDGLLGEWAILNVNTGDAIQNVIEGTEPMLVFSEDGMSVDTGCNTGGSDWELDGDELTLGAVMLTLIACEEPPGLLEQEEAIRVALESAAKVEVSPTTLTILASDGRILIEAERR
jgi:heat shock protein HslJ